ncbi:unnamed protein product, partial [Rotaria magnacalcarata]
MSWSLWSLLTTAPRLELAYHSVHYVDLIRDLSKPYEPSTVNCLSSRHAVMLHLSPVRSSYSFEYKHDPMLYLIGSIYLKGRSRFPHAFIGPMAAAMRRCENKNDQPLTDIEDALKTMAILEAAWKSSTNNMTPIDY